MGSICRHWIVAVLWLFVALPAALAQGSLGDYQRAEKFLPGNVRHLVYVADVSPHWIEKTNRFWYRRVGAKVGSKESEFVLVDAEQNTVLLLSIMNVWQLRFHRRRSKNIPRRRYPFLKSSLSMAGRQFVSPSTVPNGAVRWPPTNARRNRRIRKQLSRCSRQTSVGRRPSRNTTYT